jgi:AbrB family looped-hinge helix DNA binding protein
MNAISSEPKIEKHVSLDKAGRLVVPKAIREALQLRVGESLKIEQRDEEIVIRRDNPVPGLIRVHGLLVYDSGGPPSSIDIVGLINEDRERRSRYIAGEVDEP